MEDRSGLPDGARIAFHSKRDGNWEIYIMEADGSHPVHLTNDRAMDTVPNWPAVLKWTTTGPCHQYRGRRRWLCRPLKMDGGIFTSISRGALRTPDFAAANTVFAGKGRWRMGSPAGCSRAAPSSSNRSRILSSVFG